MENGRLARREGHDSSSSRPQGSASSIGDDPRGFRATCKDLHHTLREFYNIEVMPKTFIIKFRQRVQGVQLGANFEVKAKTYFCVAIASILQLFMISFIVQNLRLQFVIEPVIYWYLK